MSTDGLYLRRRKPQKAHPGPCRGEGLILTFLCFKMKHRLFFLTSSPEFSIKSLSGLLLQSEGSPSGSLEAKRGLLLCLSGQQCGRSHRAGPRFGDTCGHSLYGKKGHLPLGPGLEFPPGWLRRAAWGTLAAHKDPIIRLLTQQVLRHRTPSLLPPRPPDVHTGESRVRVQPCISSVRAGSHPAAAETHFQKPAASWTWGWPVRRD